MPKDPRRPSQYSLEAGSRAISRYEYGNENTEGPSSNLLSNTSAGFARDPVCHPSIGEKRIKEDEFLGTSDQQPTASSPEEEGLPSCTIIRGLSHYHFRYHRSSRGRVTFVPQETIQQMPPRKSNVSTVSATGDDGSVLQAGKEREFITIEDLSLPRTVIGRLAKGVLPPNTQIQKDAITAFTKAATVFVSYLSHNSHAHTQKAQRKTITPADVFLGLRDSEFDFMLPRLEAELDKYNQVQTSKRNEYRKKVKEGTMGIGRRKSEATMVSDEQAAGKEVGEPAAKRAKVENGAGPAREGVSASRQEEGDETVDEEEGGEAVEDEEGGEAVEEEGDEEEEDDVEEGGGGEDGEEVEVEHEEEIGSNAEDTAEEESD